MTSFNFNGKGGPLLTLFFETLEKQLCKQKTMQAEEWFSDLLLNGQMRVPKWTVLFKKPLLEDRVSRGLPWKYPKCSPGHFKPQARLMWMFKFFGELFLNWVSFTVVAIAATSKALMQEMKQQHLLFCYN